MGNGVQGQFPEREREKRGGVCVFMELDVKQSKDIVFCGLEFRGNDCLEILFWH